MTNHILSESECVDVAKLCGWVIEINEDPEHSKFLIPVASEIIPLRDLQSFIHNPLNIGYLLVGLDRFVGTDHLANRIVCNFGDSLQFGEFKKVHTGFIADLKQLVKEGE